MGEPQNERGAVNNNRPNPYHVPPQEESRRKKQELTCPHHFGLNILAGGRKKRVSDRKGANAIPMD